jgi:regulator of sigma E protease
MPQLIDNQFAIQSDTRVVSRNTLVAFVEPGSPAAKAGLQARDHLQAIGFVGDEVPVTNAARLPELTKQYAGENVVVVYERGGQQHRANIHLLDGNEAKKKGYLGVSPAEFTMTRATWSAPVQSVGLIAQFTGATFKGLGTALGALFQGDTAKASEQVSGPVGIVAVLNQGSFLGIQFILLIIGVISLSLAIMNVLPIPALDGGRLYVLLLSRVFGKRLSKDMEERIVGTSFVFLLILIVLITIVDVRRFF